MRPAPSVSGAHPSGHPPPSKNATMPCGAPGDGLVSTDCDALGDHTPYAGSCPGPSEIQCCIVTPDTHNPPIPDGYRLMMQSEVTPEMTDWAVAILHDWDTYPMFSTTT